MSTMSVSFTATGNGSAISFKRGDKLTYEISGTFSATWVIEKSEGLSNWTQVATGTGTSSATIEVTSKASDQVHYRFRCSAFSSGTMVTSIADAAIVLKEYLDNNGTSVLKIAEDTVTVPSLTVSSSINRTSQQYVVNAAGQGKVGATAGFVVAAGDDIGLVTCPASQTAATLVVPLPCLKVGYTITAFL